MEQILNGVRVLDLTQGLAGGYCAMHLGDYGAEVIKIEPPTGDPLRRRAPLKNGESPLFAMVNRNKKSVCLDITTPEGSAAALRMAKDCDILLEGFAPGRMDGWGLGDQAVRAVSPGIIYASITGFGQTGPLRDHPADDLVAAAMSGLMDRIGPRGGAPMQPGVNFGGTYAGVALLSGIAMALYRRLVSGQGCRVEVSVLDCIFYLLELFVISYSIDGAVTPKNGNHDSEVAPLGTFATRDGHAAIAISSEAQWEKFCDLTGLAHLSGDPRFARNENRIQNLDALITEIEAATLLCGKDGLARLLSENKLASGPLKTVEELLRDPQALATEMIVSTRHPTLGDFYQIGSPMKLSETPVQVLRAPAPPLGEHTDEVLSALGFTAHEIHTCAAPCYSK